MRVSKEVHVSPQRFDGTFDVSGTEYGAQLPILRTDLNGLRQLALQASKRVREAEMKEQERRERQPCG